MTEFDKSKKYRDSSGDVWSFENGVWGYRERDYSDSSFHENEPGSRPYDGPHTVVEEPKPATAYRPGDVLTSRYGHSLIIGHNGRAYSLRHHNMVRAPESVTVPGDGARPFTDVTHVNGESVVKPNPLDSAPVGAQAVGAVAGGSARTYVRLPDGWVLATVGPHTSIRGELKSGHAAARVYATSELPAGTELVES